MRYLIALFISVSGVLASFQLLKPNYNLPNQNEAREVVAIVSYYDDSGVQKMPAGQAFWVDLPSGTELYQGDSLKTDDNTIAEIKFLGSETTLKIQPQTRFVVEKKDDKFVVGNVQGNLFVENAKAQSDIQINAGGKTLDISDGKAQINVQDGKVDLALKGAKVKTNINGKEEVLSGDQAGELTESGFKEQKIKFVNVTPSFNEWVYLKDDKSLVNFSWKKVDGYKFNIHLGKTPKLIKPLLEQEIIKRKDNQISVKLQPGRYFWKIIGKNGNEVVTSEVFNNEVKMQYDPILLSPIQNEIVKFKSDSKAKQVEFKWKSASPLANTFVEIAQDSEFKQVLYSEETTAKSVKIDMAEGQYFWRITTNLKNSKIYLKSKPESLRVKYFTSSFPPKLALPNQDSKIILSEEEKFTQVALSWDRVNLAEKYRVFVNTLKGKKPIRIDKDIKDATLYLNKLEPGTYEWKVATIDKTGQLSDFSKVRKFEVMEPEKIQWLSSSNTFEYLKKPEIQIGWTKTKGAKSWNISYAPTQDFANPISETVAGTKVKLPIRLDGTYYIKVSALDENGKTIARSDIRPIKVREKPLPKRPEFAGETPERLLANSAGQLPLSFKPLEDFAHKIIIKIKDQNGEVIRLHRMQSTRDTVKGLMPGKYYISAISQDQYDRSSEPTESLALEVPEKSYVQAPKIDNIIVR
jgi:hypothetical protein